MSQTQKKDRPPLYMESSGQGDDVVFLHGWGMHGGYWQDLLEVLQENYRVHCLDLPGHGRSIYQSEASLDDFVERLVDTLDGANIKTCALVGWSMGGLIGQRLNQVYPERINKLLLMASSPCFMQRTDWPHAMAEEVLNGFANNLLTDYRSTLTRFLALQVMGSDDQKQLLRTLKAKLFSRGEPDPFALQAGLALLRTADLRENIHAKNIPQMFLGGERDALVPARALLEMAKQLPQAQVRLIKGAGHAPFLSHPLEVQNICQEFLKHE